MCIYNLYLNNILAYIYTYNYFNNNFILATICTLCEAPESNTIDSGAIQINCIIIIIIMQAPQCIKTSQARGNCAALQYLWLVVEVNGVEP